MGKRDISSKNEGGARGISAVRMREGQGDNSRWRIKTEGWARGTSAVRMREGQGDNSRWRIETEGWARGTTVGG